MSLDVSLTDDPVQVECGHHHTRRGGNLPWPENVWIVVSIENDQYAYRMDDLRQVPARCKFISFEPLLGPMPTLDFSGVDWAIVGGESGPGALVMSKAWVLGIRNQCIGMGIPFFFKQWGRTNKKRSGRILEAAHGTKSRALMVLLNHGIHAGHG